MHSSSCQSAVHSVSPMDSDASLRSASPPSGGGAYLGCGTTSPGSPSRASSPGSPVHARSPGSPVSPGRGGTSSAPLNKKLENLEILQINNYFKLL